METNKNKNNHVVLNIEDIPETRSQYNASLAGDNNDDESVSNEEADKPVFIGEKYLANLKKENANLKQKNTELKIIEKEHKELKRIFLRYRDIEMQKQGEVQYKMGKQSEVIKGREELTEKLFNRIKINEAFEDNFSKVNAALSGLVVCGAQEVTRNLLNSTHLDENVKTCISIAAGTASGFVSSYLIRKVASKCRIDI